MVSVHGTLMHNDTLYLMFNGVYLSDFSFVGTLVFNVAVFTNGRIFVDMPSSERYLAIFTLRCLALFPHGIVWIVLNSTIFKHVPYMLRLLGNTSPQ